MMVCVCCKTRVCISAKWLLCLCVCVLEIGAVCAIFSSEESDILLAFCSPVVKRSWCVLCIDNCIVQASRREGFCLLIEPSEELSESWILSLRLFLSASRPRAAVLCL